MSWKVNFFQTARGSLPVREFILDQDLATRSKITSYMDLLSKNGPFLKPPYIKKLDDKFYELRISGSVAVRIFYTMKDREYYLLHAFKKKTEKTPVNELKTALDRMREII